MTFALPAVQDNCNLGRGAGDPKWLADINSPTNTGTKPNGSLPLADSATEFDNNVNGSTKGYAKEFENGQTPAYDVSTDTKVMLWHSQCNAPNRIQVDTAANGGLILRLYSGTGAPPTVYRDFYVGGNDTPFAASISGQFPLVLDMNDESHDASNGTFDNTDVTSIGILTTRLNMSGSNTNWNYQGKMYVLDTTKTSADTPTFTGTSDFDDAVDLIQGTDYTDKLGSWVRKVGSVIFIDMGFRIGDNSTETDFNDNGLTIISPVSNDASDPRVRVTTQAFRTYLNLRNNAADTATFSGTWVWQTRAPFDWDQDDAAVVTFNSPTFRGMGDFTLGSSVTGDATWDDVHPVITADTGVDIDDSTFRNPALGYLLELTAGAMDLTDVSFSGYAAKTAITGIDAVNDVDAVNEEMDLTAHGLRTGDQILYDDGGGTAIGGLTDGDMYWVRVIDANTLDMHSTRAAALDPTSTAINLTDGVGTSHSFTPQSHAIHLNTAGTYNYSGVTFDQSGTNDIETTHASGTITINISNGGTVPTVTETGAGSVVVNNNVTVSVTVNDSSGSPIQNARVRVVADETVGTITAGDVIVEGLTNVSGVVETTTFNYEAAFDPSGLDITFKVRQGTTAPFQKPFDGSGIITSSGFSTTIAMIPDE